MPFGGFAGLRLAHDKLALGRHGSHMLDPVAASPFGLVQPHVRLLEEAFHFTFAQSLRYRESNADGGAPFHAILSHGGDGNARANLIGADESPGEIASRKDKQELFSAISPDAIVVPDAASKTVPDFSEHLISKEVPAFVVHGFEVVQVNQHDGNWRLTAPGAGKLQSECFQRLLPIQ